MAQRFSGRTALVFGASLGIGRAVVEALAGEGCAVMIADVAEAPGHALAAALGTAAFVRADVSKEDDTRNAVEATLSRFGAIDILVQNAGIYPMSLIEETTVEQWDRVLGINLRGCFLAAKAAVKPMRERGYGRIVFTSSITGPRVTAPGHGHYSASKAGILGFVRAAALEFAGYGITVNAVEPGNIVSDGIELTRTSSYMENMRQAIPLDRLGSGADVANAVLFLASEPSSYITGTSIIVDGGQILPEGNEFRIGSSATAAKQPDAFGGTQD